MNFGEPFEHHCTQAAYATLLLGNTTGALDVCFLMAHNLLFACCTGAGGG
jgi:hypothetical protein